MPPTEYEDNTPLTDSAITEYRYDVYSNAGLVAEEYFPNTGNMSEFTIDLPPDRYAVCMYARAVQWSKMNCSIFNTIEPQPPRICK